MPTGSAVSHQPTSAGDPPWRLTYAAASDSGATENIGMTQPSSSKRRSGGSANTSRIPRSESPRRPPAGGEAEPGWVRTSASAIRPAAAMMQAATMNPPRAETATISSPPTGLATICAVCTAMRISDLAGTYAASGTTARTSAPCVAAPRPLQKPATVTSVSKAPTGIPGRAITSVNAAAPR
jgi:hypothetical protein